MTVATGYFDSIHDSGTGSGWQNLSNLKSGSEAFSARYITDPASIQDVYFSTMGEIDNVPNGSQFEEMTVSWRDQADGFIGTVSVRWEGTIGGVSKTGTSFSNPVVIGSYSRRSVTGDADYWGLDSVTPSALFTAIRDGTLKLRYRVSPNDWGVNDKAYLDDVELSITYTEVDTKRGAILSCVP